MVDRFELVARQPRDHLIDLTAELRLFPVLPIKPAWMASKMCAKANECFGGHDLLPFLYGAASEDDGKLVPVSEFGVSKVFFSASSKACVARPMSSIARS